MAVVKNNQIVFINTGADHLFELDKDGDKKLHGRAVNISLNGQSNNDVIEFFVDFDDSDSFNVFP